MILLNFIAITVAFACFFALVIFILFLVPIGFAFLDEDSGIAAKICVSIWLFLAAVLCMNLFNPTSFNISKHYDDFKSASIRRSEDRDKKQDTKKVIVFSGPKSYILVSVKPPKHFYVTLKDTQTNQVFENINVSKHCNNWNSNKVGETYNLKVEQFYMSHEPQNIITNFLNLNGELCQ